MTKSIIYTDGACSCNPGPGGWAAIIMHSDGTEKTVCGGEKLTTNNKMELMATIKALESLPGDTQEISLYTDSNYVKKGITEWIFAWKKNNWQTSSRTPVKNKELWIELDRLSALHKIEWIWVKAHNGNHYNEKVDQIARAQISGFA